jgi:hypothetical protein
MLSKDDMEKYREKNTTIKILLEYAEKQDIEKRQNRTGLKR